MVILGNHLAVAEDESPLGTFFTSKEMTSGVTFEKWNPETSQFFFQKDGKPLSYELSSLLYWGAPAELSLTDFTIVLTDGSFWLGGNPQIKNEQNSESIELETFCLGTMTFPLDEAAGIIFPGISSGTQEKLLTELRDGHFEEDVLIFKTGERITGEFRSVDGKSLTFRTRDLSPESQETLLHESRNFRISVNQLAALFFSTTLHLKSLSANNSQKFFWLGLADGSFIRFQPGEEWFDFQKIPHEQIVYIESPQKSQQFFNESLTSATEKTEERRWLDELKPSGVKDVKNEAISGKIFEPSWKSGVEPDGKRLRFQGKIFRHGISVQAGTVLNWTLEDDFHLLGILPVLASINPGNPEIEVRCRIWIDGRMEAEKILDSESKPELILVELNQAKELVLETTPISENDLQMPCISVVNWLNGFLEP